VNREKKELEMWQKKELYVNFGNNFLEPMILEPDRIKMNKITLKRETIDRITRDLRFLRRRNKRAGRLITEQTTHLGEMIERYNKLRAIAKYFGIFTDPQKKKEMEDMKKRYHDLIRAISILEKSIL
jgi:hypothetical protein